MFIFMLDNPLQSQNKSCLPKLFRRNLLCCYSCWDRITFTDKVGMPKTNFLEGPTNQICMYNYQHHPTLRDILCLFRTSIGQSDLNSSTIKFKTVAYQYF